MESSLDSKTFLSRKVLVGFGAKPQAPCSLLLSVSLDVGEVGNGLELVTRNDHQSGRLLDAVLGHQILVLLAHDQLVVGNAGLVQEHTCGLAVGAGGGGEEDGLGGSYGSVTDGDGLGSLGGRVLSQGLLAVLLSAMESPIVPAPQ